MVKCDWVVLKYDVNPNLWICERCGEKVEQPTPMRLSTAIACMEGFMKVHKKCKVKKDV